MDPSELLQYLPPSVNPEQVDFADLLGYSQPAAQLVAEGPVTSPSQLVDPGAQNTPQTVDLPPRPMQPGQGMGAGVGVQGYSPAANAAIRKGPHAAVERDMAADRVDVQNQFAPTRARSEQAAADAVAAEASTGQLESQKLAATAESRMKIAEAQNDFLTKEQAAVANSQAEAKASMADYKAALQDYAAAQVNPAQLWEAAGHEGQFAMLATAFLHDFLGVKGIKTSGMDSIKSAIQNNISAQIENMNKKQAVANGFKQLWEMQRAQSATDAEARVRMNGFYLQALTNEIDARLGTFDSKLALTKSEAAKAKLMQEQVKNDLLLQQHIDTSANQRAKQRVDMYQSELAASSARYTADAHIKAAQIAAGAKAQSPLEGVIVDVSASGKNTAIRRFLPGMSKDAMDDIRGKVANAVKLADNIKRLQAIQEEVGKVVPTGDMQLLHKLQNEAARTAEVVRNLVRMGIIYDASGKQINPQEVKIYDQIVAKNDWWTNGDNIRPLATVADMSLGGINTVLRGVSTEIQPGDPAYGFQTGDKGVAPGEKTETEIQSSMGSGRPQDTEADKYTKWAESPNALEHFNPEKLPEEGPGNRGTVKKDWDKFNKDDPKFAQEAKRAKEDVRYSERALPTRGFIQLERLADLALAGDKQAKSTIERMANEVPDTDQEGILAAYAQFELAKLRGGLSVPVESDSVGEE